MTLSSNVIMDYVLNIILFVFQYAIITSLLMYFYINKIIYFIDINKSILLHNVDLETLDEAYSIFNDNNNDNVDLLEFLQNYKRNITKCNENDNN
jgi:hypothetical protein